MKFKIHLFDLLDMVSKFNAYSIACKLPFRITQGKYALDFTKNKGGSKKKTHSARPSSNPPSTLSATSYNVILAMRTRCGLKCFRMSVAIRSCSSAANSTPVGPAPTMQKLSRLRR